MKENAGGTPTTEPLNHTEPFDQGPFSLPLRAMKLGGTGPRQVLARAALAVLLTWVPMVVLAAVQGLALSDNLRESILVDVRVHGIYLLALPLLVLAETSVLRRLATNARYFWDSGLVPAERRQDFDAAFASARRLLSSRWTTVIVVLAAVVLMLAVRQGIPQEPGPDWRHPERLGGGWSWAGLWQRWVGLPLFFGAFLSWVWRFGVWGRFLLVMTRLDLRIVPADPDGRGGLGFMATSLPPCGLLGFAFSVAIASGMMQQIIHEGASPLAWKWIPAVLVAFVLVLCVTPLLVLYPTMLSSRRRALYEYRTLTLAVGRQFQGAWLSQRAGESPDALKAPDFSATTDLFSIAANAHRMAVFPLDLSSIVSLVLPTLLPFIPVLLTIVPVGELLKAALGLVL